MPTRAVGAVTPEGQRPADGGREGRLDAMVGAEGAAVPRSVRQVHPVEVAHQVAGRTWMALTPVRLTTPKPLVTRLLCQRLHERDGGDVFALRTCRKPGLRPVEPSTREERFTYHSTPLNMASHGAEPGGLLPASGHPGGIRPESGAPPTRHLCVAPFAQTRPVATVASGAGAGPEPRSGRSLRRRLSPGRGAGAQKGEGRGWRVGPGSGWGTGGGGGGVEEALGLRRLSSGGSPASGLVGMLPRNGLYVVAFGDSPLGLPQTGSRSACPGPSAAFLRGSDGNNGLTWAIS